MHTPEALSKHYIPYSAKVNGPYVLSELFIIVLLLIKVVLRKVGHAMAYFWQIGPEKNV